MSIARRPETDRRAPDARALPCPCCKEGTLRLFHEVEGVPTNSCILLETREEALAWPRGDIRLGFCEACGFISNTAFDPALTEYSGRYEETQAFSPTFNRFHEQLARELVERHGLQEKDIIEIGCGKGEFLHLLCALGDNRGLGYDPGYSEERGRALGAGRFEVVRDFFGPDHTERQADFVACKMTLEHIPTPHDFVDVAMRVARRPDGVVFIQVPESLRIVRDCAFEDIYYEHCSYFTAGSLARLFERLGFEVTNTEITYGDQYLTVEARPAPAGRPAAAGTVADLAALREAVDRFPETLRARLAAWSARLAAWGRDGKRVMIWGSGSKGVSFLATVPGAEVVSHAVDINPYRRGYFMAGSGQPILGPEDLETTPPDVVIVMNRVYVPEIRETLAEHGLHPELHAL
ncbi:MAG: class I SAM-dependent methyltransferase [Pseudomonadales bacterium]|jgi:SAM-dependent methyltransferase|nr:class I SAM-dependent methyltransferase [Pseudomonadales bacterium]